MTKYDNKELCLIWLDSFSHLEYNGKKVLFDIIKGKPDIKQLLICEKDYISSRFGDKVFNMLVESANPEYFKGVIDGLEKRKITAVTVESELYPEKLLNIETPPLVIYAKGNVELLNRKCFAIVGSRKSLPLSIKLASDYTEEVIKCGFVPVTGIAQGVDATVLEKSLTKGGICVLAGGHDNVYPAVNKDLAEKLTDNGLVISEYPPQVVSQKYFFPIRNRIIAGLGDGVLVVSGALKSGTLHTANYAMEYGRDLFAIPYGVGVESGAGCNDLIKRGAFLTDTPKDISTFYGIEVESCKIELSKEEKEVLFFIKESDGRVEKICEKHNIQVYELAPILMNLEIKGAIIKNGINTYTVSRDYLEE